MCYSPSRFTILNYRRKNSYSVIFVVTSKHVHRLHSKNVRLINDFQNAYRLSFDGLDVCISVAMSDNVKVRQIRYIPVIMFKKRTVK